MGLQRYKDIQLYTTSWRPSDLRGFQTQPSL